jgi:NADPH-dependent F420 reductase
MASFAAEVRYVRIGLVGGTGDLGAGLALRLSKEHNVVIGSRSPERARRKANEYRRAAASFYRGSMNGTLTGGSNVDAVRDAELVVLTVEASSIEKFISESSGWNWEGRVLLSPVVRMEKNEQTFVYKPFRSRGVAISAAEYIQRSIPGCRVLSALHLVPAAKLRRLEASLEYDVPVAGPIDLFEFLRSAFGVIEGLRFLYAGPLPVSYQIESALPLLLNIASKNGISYPGIRVV